MSDKFLFKGSFDFPIFLVSLLLWGIGNALIYSATRYDLTGFLSNTFQSQLLWTAVGVVVILLFLTIPTSLFYKISPIIYFSTLFFLMLVIFDGQAAKGAARWIELGGFRIQPSEFAKIGLLFMLARYLTTHSVSLFDWKTMVKPSLIILAPFLLVLKQPDLGTALVFFGLSIPMFYWSGMSLREVFYLLTPVISVVLSAIPLVLSFTTNSDVSILASIPWALFFIILVVSYLTLKPPLFITIWTLLLTIITATATTYLWSNLLKDYQKMRVVSFINPQLDPMGAGYQVIQSIITLGSGQFWGKGYLQGTQVNLSYLPEQHTDFIFSVLGEQFGFFGISVVLFLYLFIIFRAIRSTRNIRMRFANLLIVGASSMLAFHIIINIAMVIGMMPVTGLPLPFLSYGGSFTLTVSMLIGIMLNAKGDRANY